MKSLDQIVAEVTAAHVRLQINTDALTRVSGTNPNELFHTPLLALTILTITRARKAGLPTSDLATWTLGTLSKHFEGFLTGGRIQWSVPLRRRCADALVFLENVGLAEVRQVPVRTVYISMAGRGFISKLARAADECGVLVRQLERAHHAVEQGGLELL